MTTDLIVGFPGETREQFLKSLELVEMIKFDKVHASIYSDRPGTIASRKMGDDVSRDEKMENGTNCRSPKKDQQRIKF